MDNNAPIMYINERNLFNHKGITMKKVEKEII